MSWAKFAIEKLKNGEASQIRPRGHSMKGNINVGDLVTVEPCDPEELSVDDIVLVRGKGNDYLHLIKAKNQGRFLIGNNRGGVNGWVGHNCIYSVATKIKLRSNKGCSRRAKGLNFRFYGLGARLIPGDRPTHD